MTITSSSKETDPPHLRSCMLLTELQNTQAQLNSLPNNTILALTKFKAYADDRITVTQKLKFVLGRVENIVGKGENAGYQHFLLFHNVF